VPKKRNDLATPVLKGETDFFVPKQQARVRLSKLSLCLVGAAYDVHTMKSYTRQSDNYITSRGSICNALSPR
jgi:hypothetical protein